MDLINIEFLEYIENGTEEIKKPLKMDLTPPKPEKPIKFYLPSDYIDDSNNIKNKFIDFIDDDLIIMIMNDNKLKKLIDNNDIKNYCLYCDDIRNKLITYINYLFYYMSDYDLNIFLRINYKFKSLEDKIKVFKELINKFEYKKALKMVNLNKFFKDIYNKNYIITPEQMENKEPEEEEEEEEEYRTRENDQADDIEKTNDKRFRRNLENSKQHFYIELKESLNRLNYYQEQYKNFVNDYKEANPQHQKNIKRIKEEYLKGFKIDDFIIKPVYNLIYLLYKSYNLFLLQPKYKITLDNDFFINILDIETKEEITTLIFEDMEDQEIILNQYLKDNIYLFSHSFLKPLFLNDYLNNYIYVNSKGDIIEDMTEDNFNNLFDNEYKSNDDIYNNIHLESVLDGAINSDGLNHILFYGEAEEITFKNTTILIKFDN